MRLQKLLWALLLPVSMLSACGDDDVTCGEGTVRQGNRCVADADGGFAGSAGIGGRGGTGGGGSGTGGQSGLECGDGTHEVDGECVPDDGEPALLPVGSACTAAGECATGTCATTDTLPGGYCTILGCSADNPCPVGSTCYASATGVRLCMAFCEGDVECREGDDYNCQPLYTNPLGICAPSCTITGQCTSGTRCNEDTGLCELTNCDPEAAESACADDETCWPDTRGLAQDGGLCLRLCDPADPDATCLATKEVCQPLAADPANTGFCAPPVCSATHECPPGAICQNDVCQPPALCDDDTPCGDDLVCVAGKCLSECPSSGTCADIHPDLVCADVLAEPACLPVGSFPGSACRANRDDACSSVTAGDATAPMVCQDDLCLVDCTTGGSELCEDVSDTLACATGIFDTALCLPKGAFPGGPCGAGDTCAQDLEGNPDVDMVCLEGTCVIDCDEDNHWDGWGDAMCQIVSPALTCSETAGDVCVRACVDGDCDDGYSCFDPGDVPDDENACLPDGSFPGSACRAGAASGEECDDNLGGVDAVDQRCVSGTCVVECDGTDTICEGLSSALTCATAAGNICVLECVGNACLPGYSCLSLENACLPDGTFPGSECRDGAAAGEECDDNLGGNDAVDQRCVNDTCVVECPGDTEAICDGVSASLTCSESAGEICVVACVAGNCLPGFSCLDPGGENACLPTGSFPGSPCRATVGDECDADVGGNADADMVCVEGTCVVACPSNNDALCTAVSDVLTCSESAGNLCVLECTLGACPTGYSCLDPTGENACLPDGSFPGSACRAESGNECDENLGGDAAVDMVCVEDTCVIDCQTNQDMLCSDFNDALTCSESAGDICVFECTLGDCPTGYSCLSPTGENACLPDGSFPGSACRTEVGNECDDDLGGNTNVDQRCVSDTCVVECPGDTEVICNGVSTSLTCAAAAGNICVLECVAGECPTGYSCLAGENACLPDGSFPGSDCRAEVGNECDDNLGGVDAIDQRCIDGTCVVECPGDAEATCDLVSPALTCSESAGDICVVSCATNPCPTGYSCLEFDDEDACLPTGSFPSSPCRDTVGDECDQNLLGMDQFDMVCTQADLCAVSCAGNAAVCPAFDPTWTCAELAGSICLIDCASDPCPTGYACTPLGADDVCLPN